MTPTIFEVAEQAARANKRSGRAGKRKPRTVRRSAKGHKTASPRTSRQPAPKRRTKARKSR